VHPDTISARSSCTTPVLFQAHTTTIAWSPRANNAGSQGSTAYAKSPSCLAPFDKYMYETPKSNRNGCLASNHVAATPVLPGLLQASNISVPQEWHLEARQSPRHWLTGAWQSRGSNAYLSLTYPLSQRFRSVVIPRPASKRAWVGVNEIQPPATPEGVATYLAVHYCLVSSSLPAAATAAFWFWCTPNSLAAPIGPQSGSPGRAIESFRNLAELHQIASPWAHGS
jgi:hypothetical protein